MAQKAAQNVTILRMKFLACLLLCIVCGLALWSPGRSSRAQQQERQLVQTGSTASGKRIALVIGNGAYTNAPTLKNPSNDARDMAATLSQLGFAVEHGVNLNQKQMKFMIRQFGQKLKAGGQGVFYYSGHGVQSKGRNYLIPVDALIESEADLEDAGVDVQFMLNYMDDAQNGLNIVILDACRNNPFGISMRSAENGLAQVDAPTGTLIAYATAPGRVASDGTGKNGLYTSELLKQMKAPGVSVTEMFMRVRAEVVKQTGGKQVPWEASSLIGSFSFNATNNASTATTPSSTGTASSSTFSQPNTTDSAEERALAEVQAWNKIRESTKAAAFLEFLTQYSNGKFAASARERLNSLIIESNQMSDLRAFLALYPNAAVAARVRERLNSLMKAEWEKLKKSEKPEDYKAYIAQNPNRPYVVVARERMNMLIASMVAWEEISDSKKVDEFKSYLKRFPEGAYAREAKARVGLATLQPLIKNRVGIELVLIKPGVFRMGTYAINHTENYLGAGADRRPEHQVTIRDLFYIGKYEVTQAQWQRVMGTNPSEYKGENLPVGNISWIETQEFIQKLNTMNDGFTYRLPAEAEWEYACRAGTTEDYAGDLDSMAWYGNNSGQGYLHADYIPGYEYSQRLRANGNQPHPVGTKKPNGFGLYDMHGNVLEWCQDAYHGDYEGAPTDGSAWEDGKAQEARMQRGGSYFAFNWLCSSAYRTAEKVDDRKRTVGFRLVAVART